MNGEKEKTVGRPSTSSGRLTILQQGFPIVFIIDSLMIQYYILYLFYTPGVNKRYPIGIGGV